MADLLLANGRIVTMDPGNPRGRWIAVESGRIRAIGVGNPPDRHRGPSTRCIDLAGRTVLPGFIDAHLHFRALAESLATIPLGPQSGIQSISDIADRIHKEAQNHPPGTWIRAAGYNEVYLSDNRHPDRRDLDQASPHHPVKLTYRSGHAHVLNSLGLKAVGINRETDDPAEGIIDRDYESGEPTGMLWGLGDLLSRRIPAIDEALLAQGIGLADRELVSNGITSFQDASARNDRDRWRWYGSLKRDGAIRPRATMMLGWRGFGQYREKGFPAWIDENELCLRGVKIILDETTGMLNPDPDRLKEMVTAVHRAGLQASLHAIEPSAIAAAVEALSHALRAFPREDHRHRIEHCSVCPPGLIRAIASLGIMVTTHPAFLYYSGDRYLKTVPADQRPHLYPIGSLLRSGVAVSAASDAPIVDVSPISGIYSAVTRRAESGEPILAEESISRDRAIGMYTLYAAMAAFHEQTRGSLIPGKLADMVILSGNPQDVSANAIKDIMVDTTIIGGQIIWSREG